MQLLLLLLLLRAQVRGHVLLLVLQRLQMLMMVWIMRGVRMSDSMRVEVWMAWLLLLLLLLRRKEMPHGPVSMHHEGSARASCAAPIGHVATARQHVGGGERRGEACRGGEEVRERRGDARCQRLVGR